MNERMITILVNEQRRNVPDRFLLGDLKDQVKPGADVLIVNGFFRNERTRLNSGDDVVLIRRGEIQRGDELEALMIARHTPGVHDRLKKATVGIAGLGGLGSNVAIALARMGIGALILADYDVVVPSNLNRQQYSLKHIGMAKTDAMTQILKDINPYIRVVEKCVVLNSNNVPQIFKEAEIVVECLDCADSKIMFIQTVTENLPHVYLIGASGVAGYGESNSIKTIKLSERIFMVGDLESEAAPGRGLMAPRVGIAACHQANLVIGLLMDTDRARL